ncbi:nickel pincer cofactor biosynthesis protein LarC [Catenulispora rubra]|uniref:nickel pincer cofactor biosynthesis protein LarC n=1 Tax=Catenulispora rubra TaxID=280293 RepID=UPI0018926A00|nr:nickel pincer cofactor biosynthesis protein LarC [Catenulispora rubra]
MICWINPFTGLAGDMLLAALLDAGAPIEPVRAAIAATGLTGWDLAAERVTDHGLAATRVHVRVTDHASERRAAELIALASAAVPQPVAARAVAALQAIAEVEARIHDADPASVHLHELGGHDTVVDVVGVAAAMHALGVDDVVCAPLPLGTGRVRSAHGLIPAPAPATLALLTGAAVIGTDIPGETVTPTGAALLRALNARFDPVPAMTVRATGYGAGTRSLADRPNVVAVTLGERRGGGGDGEIVTVLETNLDDVNGEVLGHVIARSLEAGALDAWATPAVMRKGRLGHVLHLLVRPQDCDALQKLLFVETGALGLRRSSGDRMVLRRWSETVQIGSAA